MSDAISFRPMTAADIDAVREAGCAGIVLGRALLEGRFALADVLGEATPC